MTQILNLSVFLILIDSVFLYYQNICTYCIKSYLFDTYMFKGKMR